MDDFATHKFSPSTGHPRHRQVGISSASSPQEEQPSQDNQDEREGEHDAGVATVAERPKLKQPPLYKVVLINDDYTPMEFVVDVLRSFFGMNMTQATRIMLKVHTEGKGVCGVYSKDVAESKSAQVNDYSRECEQPLKCSVEAER